MDKVEQATNEIKQQFRDLEETEAEYRSLYKTFIESQRKMHLNETIRKDISTRIKELSDFLGSIRVSKLAEEIEDSEILTHEELRIIYNRIYNDNYTKSSSDSFDNDHFKKAVKEVIVMKKQYPSLVLQEIQTSNSSNTIPNQIVYNFIYKMTRELYMNSSM